jgi:hypothetical protein
MFELIYWGTLIVFVVLLPSLALWAYVWATSTRKMDEGNRPPFRKEWVCWTYWED